MSKSSLLALSLALSVSAAAQAPVPFSAKVTGKGPAMILIPGLTSAGTVWDSTVAVFSKRYQTHALTLAGFAGQPALADTGSYVEAMEKAVVEYVRTKRLGKVVLVGHSLGGFLVLTIARDYPDLPSAVVNIDGLPFLGAAGNPAATVESVRPQAQGMRTMMARGDSASFARAQAMQIRMMVHDSAHQAMASAWGAASDRGTTARAMFDLYSNDLRPSLGAITAPVLNLHAWAAYKQYGVTRESTEKMLASQYATLRTGTTRINDSAYHFIMLDDPKWVAEEMSAFLKGGR